MKTTKTIEDMTSEEKADEMIKKFMPEQSKNLGGNLKVVVTHIQRKRAIECALICVDEIIKLNPHKVDYVGDSIDPLVYEKVFTNTYQYWQDVKQQLLKQ